MSNGNKSITGDQSLDASRPYSKVKKLTLFETGVQLPSYLAPPHSFHSTPVEQGIENPTLTTL